MSAPITPLIPVAFCEAHLERAGVRVPAYRLGLCQDCFNGKPINTKLETIGGLITDAMRNSFAHAEDDES